MRKTTKTIKTKRTNKFNFLKRLRSKRGFTLVEVIMATAVFALITAAAFSLQDPVNKIYNSVRGDSNLQRVATAAEGYISRQLREASQIEMHWSSKNTGDVRGSQISNWDDIANAMNEFVADKNGTTDIPQALIVKQYPNETRIFNVRLNEIPKTGDPLAPPTVADFKTLLAADDAQLEPWRVFNRSFFGDATLAFELSVSDVPFKQVRGKTFLSTRVEAFRGGDLSLTSESVSMTELAWIGNVDGPSDSEVKALRAMVYTDDLLGMNKVTHDPLNPSSGKPPAVNGEFVVLYHNNVHYDRDDCCDLASPTVVADCVTDGERPRLSCVLSYRDDVGNIVDDNLCPNAGKSIVITPALGHLYETSWTYDFTPNVDGTSKGKMTKKCLRDGCAAKIEQDIPQCSSEDCGWEVVDATCLSDGYKQATCTNEDCQLAANNVREILPKLPHEPLDDDCTTCKNTTTDEGGNTISHKTGTSHKSGGDDCTKCINCGAVREGAEHKPNMKSNCTTCSNRGCKALLEKTCCDDKECTTENPCEADHCYNHQGVCKICGDPECIPCGGEDGCEMRLCEHVKDIDENYICEVNSHRFNTGAFGAVDGDCTKGITIIQTCNKCGVLKVRELSGNENHVYSDNSWVTNDADETKCGEQSSQIRRCMNGGCKAIETRKGTDTIPHKYGLWEEITPAECEIAGEQKRECIRKNCNNDSEATQTREIPALKHVMREQTISEPTCTKEGEKRQYCITEGCEKDDAIILEALGHNFKDATWDAARDSEGNKDEDRCIAYCKRLNCPETMTHDSKLSPWESVVELNGSSTVHARVCSFVYDENSENSEGGDEDGENNVPSPNSLACNRRDTQEHYHENYPNEITWKNSDENNNHFWECAENCGYIAEKSHGYSEWIPSGEGETHERTCDVCNNVEIKDHTFPESPTVVVELTCTQDGYKDWKCTACNADKTGYPKEESALGHDWDDDSWTTSSDSDKYEERVCERENCNATERRCKAHQKESPCYACEPPPDLKLQLFVKPDGDTIRGETVTVKGSGRYTATVDGLGGIETFKGLVLRTFNSTGGGNLFDQYNSVINNAYEEAPEQYRGSGVKITVVEIKTDDKNLTHKFTSPLQLVTNIKDAQNRVNVPIWTGNYDNNDFVCNLDDENFYKYDHGGIANDQNGFKFPNSINSFTVSFYVCMRESHDFTEWETTVSQSCVAYKTETRSCSECGIVETNTGDELLPHDMVKVEGSDVAATCQQAGGFNEECSAVGCDKGDFVKTEEKTGHVMQRDGDEIAATCRNKGGYNLKCITKGCIETGFEETTSKQGHNTGDYVNNYDGTKTKTCQNDGCDASETVCVKCEKQTPCQCVPLKLELLAKENGGDWKVHRNAVSVVTGGQHKVTVNGCSVNGFSGLALRTYDKNQSQNSQEFEGWFGSGSGWFETDSNFNNDNATIYINSIIAGGETVTHDFGEPRRLVNTSGNFYGHVDLRLKENFTLSQNVDSVTVTFTVCTTSHAFDEETIMSEASCIAKKKVSQTCIECGYSNVSEVGEKLSHNLGSYVDNTDGETKTAACQNTGCDFSETVCIEHSNELPCKACMPASTATVTRENWSSFAGGSKLVFNAGDAALENGKYVLRPTIGEFLQRTDGDGKITIEYTVPESLAIDGGSYLFTSGNGISVKLSKTDNTTLCIEFSGGGYAGMWDQGNFKPVLTADVPFTLDSITVTNE